MKQMLKQFFQKSLPAGVQYILSWRWVKQFLYWLIISAGTIAECCFLIASLWMSVNSSVHPMILTMMSEQKSIQLSYIATTIFTALPELIVAMALVTTINHCRNIRREKAYWYTWIWPILFGLPSMVFLYISIMTVSCSVLKVNYVMPDWGIVSRALAGYTFAIVYLLYEKLGEPCYASERKGLEQTIADQKAEMEQANEKAQRALAEKQSKIEQVTSRFEDALKTANSNFTIAMQSKQSEFEYQVNAIVEEGKNRIESLQNLLEAKSIQVEKLSERASSLERNELALYPKVQSLWVERAKRTVSFDEIVDATGLSKQRIRAAITGGKIARDNRNKELLRVSSVVEWLKTIPVSEAPIPVMNGHSSEQTINNESDPLGLPVFTILED